MLAEIGPNVVDTGVAVAGWADGVCFSFDIHLQSCLMTLWRLLHVYPCHVCGVWLCIPAHWRCCCCFGNCSLRPVATSSMLERYMTNARKDGGQAPDAFVNACGSHWGQPVNGWLSDGVTPVINSVCYGPSLCGAATACAREFCSCQLACLSRAEHEIKDGGSACTVCCFTQQQFDCSRGAWCVFAQPCALCFICGLGPPGNHSSDGHYLYYYRDRLDPEDPAGDLASRIAWAASSPNSPSGARIASTRQSPQFILVFGGLGLYVALATCSLRLLLSATSHFKVGGVD